MLVLTRKIEESIIINENIKITVLGIDNDRVSLGIAAPREVKIFRSELLDETRRTNKEALSLPTDLFGGVKKEDG